MNRIRRIINSKWLQHSVFWVLSIYAIGSYFSISNFFQIIDLIYAIIFHIPLMILVYLNLNWWIPRYLSRGKYWKYLLATIGNIGIAYLAHEGVFEFVLPLIPEIYMVSFIDVQVLFTIFLIYMVVSTLYWLAKSWYHLQSIEKEKLTVELNSLKSQVNPHFLFNSLNSIYSLSLQNDQRTPQVILELSELMRYMLYKVGDDKVPLTKEIEIMKVYIDLQKLRADKSTKIEFEIIGDPEDVEVAPLLFMPLIENSFKHGVKGASEQAFVNIKMRIKSYEVRFDIENNKGQVDDPEKGKYGGIGLENVKKRMSLIYPDSRLDIKETNEVFKVTAVIDL